MGGGGSGARAGAPDVAGHRSVENNRSGPAMVDLEFRAELDRFRLEPAGGFVAERVAD